MISKSAKDYCCEDISLIENYDAAMNDPHNTWEIHHRGEILPCGKFSHNDLKKFGLYYNRPAKELIFLTCSDHTTLHKRGQSPWNKGVPRTKAERDRISASRKGIPAWNKGKHHSEKTREKISERAKARDNTRQLEAMRNAVKGSHWWNDGTKNVLAKECPVGFRKGRIVK